MANSSTENQAKPNYKNYNMMGENRKWQTFQMKTKQIGVYINMLVKRGLSDGSQVEV